MICIGAKDIVQGLESIRVHILTTCHIYAVMAGTMHKAVSPKIKSSLSGFARGQKNGTIYSYTNSPKY
jgi:hypothetical protein